MGGKPGFVPKQDAESGCSPWLLIQAYPPTMGIATTAHTLRRIGESDLEFRLMFGKEYDTMHERMQGKQEPWIQAKLSGRQYYFKQSR